MNLIRSPLKLHMQGSEVADLQGVLQFLLERDFLTRAGNGDWHQLLAQLRRERADAEYGEATFTLVSTFQELRGLDATGEVDDRTAEMLNTLLQKFDGAGMGGAAGRRFEGRVVFEDGRPAPNLRLRLYQLDFGGSAKRLSETVSGGDGSYELPLDVNASAAALELRAAPEGRKEIALTNPLYDLDGDARVELNLVAPSLLQPIASEYERLAAELEAHVGDMARLAEAREDGEQQDFTLLNRATGWDARVIALAASAAALSSQDQVNMSQEALYGLLRAGLPSDPDQLAHVSRETVSRALAKAEKSGIVSLGDGRDEALAGFQSFADARRLAELAPGSNASYADLLKASGLSDSAQATFASVYLNHRGSDTELWERAREAGVSEKDVRALQRQGKFAFLTYNNPTLASRLQDDREITNPEQLPEHDFHEAATWKRELKAAAGDSTTTLAELIPPAYGGKKLESRLNAYAEDMARKVRISYPTQVVARRLERDSDNAFALGETRGDTANLLKAAAGKGFRLGETPVVAFMKANPDVTGGLSASKFEIAQGQLQTLARVYQMTPGDGAMPIMMQLGLTAAQDVVQISQAEFAKRYANKLGSEELAKQIHDKARLISDTVYNIFTIAKKMDAEVPVAGISATTEEQESVRDELIKHYPTLEALFGSLDYCECEHCRSVLSPAAYLVDLLQFIDPPVEVWNSFLQHWKSEHGGQDYPHKESGKALTPYDVLRKRRPDIPCISLTCENTNTALPYIDVVNEILEYYVAHNNTLSEQAARDTGSATTAELLAEPQNVIADAYDTLRQAHHALGLPFDLWLSTVREFCDHFETPLAELLETFRESDDLFAPTQPYDRSAVFFEQLGLSPAEVAIFTSTNPLSSWWELYGYTSATQATTSATDADTGQRIDLNSAKALARRLGVTYKQLVEIVRTGFVNPQLADLVILNKLGVETQDVLDFADNKAFYDANKDLLGKDRSTLSAADQARFDALTPDDWTKLGDAQGFEDELDDITDEYKDFGFDAKTWLQSELAAGGFDDVLLLADPDTGCNFDKTILRYADGDAADPIAFLRINLFVRLWRKLGWTIEETDRALQAFVPKDAPFDTANLNKAPLKTALVYIAHLKALDSQLRVGRQSRLKLITLWSQIATRGPKPLYAQLFLTPGVLRTDSVFDDPLGNYLSAAGLTAMAESRTHEVSVGNVSSANKLTASAFSAFPRLTVSYDAVQKVQYLSYRGVLTNTVKGQIAALSTSPVLTPLLNAVQVKAAEFKLVKGHLPALQGALGLTADEITDILADAGKDIVTEGLSLDAVSLLYRYSLLAKALKLRVRDMIDLRQLANLDPFRALVTAPLAQLSDDRPFTQTLEFVKLAGQVKESGLTIEDLQYLLRHSFDPKGKYRPDAAGMLALVKALASGVAAIRADHAVPADPGTLSDEELRQELGLALPADVVTTLLAMLAGTAEFTATKTGVSAADQLKPEAFVDEPRIVELSYNATRGEQKLTFRGVLLSAEKNDLKTRFPKPAGTAPFVASAVFGALLDDVETQARAFFDRHLLKQPATFSPATGFLDNADYALLFGPAPTGQTQAQQQTRLRGQRARLEQAFLPYLQQKLIRQLVVDALTAQLGADSALTEALVTDKALLGSPPLLDTFAATSDRGVTVTFLNGTSTALATKRLDDADTALKDSAGAPLKPAGTAGATVQGYLEVPATGAYRFYVALDRAAAEAELRFDHLPDALIDGAAAAASAELSEVVELKAGVPYRFKLELRKLGTGDARLRVQGESLPKDRLSKLTLYPEATVASAQRALVLLAKVLQLIAGLGLSEREVRYLLTHAADFGNLDLRKLPTAAADDTLAGARALFAQFMRLAGYAQLKEELAPGSDELIDVFEANAIDIDTAYDRIAKLTRRKKPVVAATASALSSAPAFASELALERLWDALQVVERFGVAVDSLTSWTRIVSPQATGAQLFAIARDVKEALKARFSAEGWQRLAQPIFDRLRQRQRDALVAHVMHEKSFERVEQLYEHFLIDPAMEPVVQTSRIRLAISSLQLFIQRCLLNLEPKVHPSTINSGQWEWMKRYRVWEANRKIFLFPENWLEPEFRDDKTHLFTEVEGKLLAGDVSNDLVEDAFLNYLKKLEELARLDIVAMHIEDKADPVLNVLHVIGRTFSEPHKYFYRRYAHQMWTPWEPVSAEIEGDHLAPVVWRERLYLFWVTFLEKAEAPKVQTDQTEPLITGLKVSDLAGAAKEKTIEAHLHWSEYVKGEWSTRASAGPVSGTPVVKHNVTDWDPGNVFVHVSKEPYENGEERGVYIHMSGAIERAFYLAGRNSTPAAAAYGGSNGYGPPEFPLYHDREEITRYGDEGNLEVYYRKQVITKGGRQKRDTLDYYEVLKRGLTADTRYTMLTGDNDITFATPEIAALIRPFFYADAKYTFYVQPEIEEKITESWTGWIAKNPGIVFDLDKPDVKDFFEELQIVPGIPHRAGDGIVPFPPMPDGNGDVYFPVSPEGTFHGTDRYDWLINPATALSHGGELIGPEGRTGATVLTAEDAGAAVELGANPVTVNAGSDVAAGGTVVQNLTKTLSQGGLFETSAGLNVVGPAGLNQGLLSNTYEREAGAGVGNGFETGGRP